MSERKAYQEKLQAQLDSWEADISKLRAKADKAGADARIKYYEQLDELESQRSKLKKELEDLKRAGDDAWRDLKAGAEKTRNAVSDAIRAAISRFQ